MNLNFGAYSLTMFYRLKDKQKDSKEPLDSIMVRFYAHARTYFSTKSQI